MRFLVDESAGTAIVAYLRAVGHDVVAVAEATPQAADSDILSQAFIDNRIVLTNDKDFGELVFRNGQAHAGIVLFRVGDESPQNRVRVLAALLDQYGDRLLGHFVVVTERNVRLRPIGPPQSPLPD